MPRLLKNADPNDELYGLTVAEIRNQYKKLKSKYDKIYGGFYCHSCAKFLPSDKFYISNKWASGVVPTCKECLGKVALGFNPKTKKNSPTEETFKEALQLCNLPFKRQYYNSALKAIEDIPQGVRKTTVFQQYMGMIQSLPQLQNLNWLDSDFEDIEEGYQPDEIKLSKSKKETAIKRFGNGFSDGDYLFLENEYEDWVARYTCENKAQETLFIRICCKQLEIHKAQLNGEDTKELDKTLQELMSSLNIKPSQRNASSMTDNKVFGQLIDDWEQHDPIPEPSDEFKDVDNIGLYLTVFFYGHLAKMMNLKNAFSRIYDKYIRKWAVEKNIYEEDEESEEIFDKLFGSIGEENE